MDKKDKWIGRIMLVIMTMIVIGIIVFRIWIVAKYGNKPVQETPVWVLWFMQK